MTTLITGGGSNIGTRLALLLKEAGRSVLFGSRSGLRIPDGFDSVKLDWDDPTTFENPFKTDHTIESVYLIGPTDNLNPGKPLKPFIDLAVQKGVKRFVYLSGSGADSKNNIGGLGEVPGYLEEKGLDRWILRPTWFTDNLLTAYSYGIRANGEFQSVIPTGRVPFVATDDIAKAAFEGIVAEENKVKDVIVIGPELLTYDELAAITSDVLGKKVVHKAVPPEVLEEIYRHIMSEEVAKWLIQAELEVEAGSEEKWGTLTAEEQEKLKVKVFVGTMTVRDWVEKNKAGFA
ncbi:NmrA family protein [Coprinopsis cinerea okayama7|uniref:NmrA family protein n=1 Tax=Coprinopsis cinerea (strain Okayama-7 / 130 / ATCC MYA-4618 / FGSC 9003) TaxID=240176 RepID=A8NQE5_COPC7|nr:NmrA family protein [Coprinopsis cinerea okayama7\|eukprot:XP_001835538.1 NmrA family protein [Coprinopsis cinerea okayama7\